MREVYDIVRATLCRTPVNRDVLFQGERIQIMSAISLYSIGHGNRTLEQLVNLLRYTDVQLVVDVRADRRPSRYPQFTRARLQTGLAIGEIRYLWAGLHLGALCPPHPDSPHITQTHHMLRSYGDKMNTDAFHGAIMEVVGLAAFGTVVLLGEEYLPERCHRSLIADFLTLRDVRVVHLIDENLSRDHVRCPELRRTAALR